MLRAEAIKILKAAETDHFPYEPEKLVEAFELAIASLETDEVYQLEYEKPTTKNDLGVDCIKKSDAIDIIQDMHGLARADVISDAVNRIITMPSVTPQEPKTGHWDDIPKYKDIAWRCSECGHFTTMKHNYCPSCGAKMVEPQESEG